jgi:flagellar motor switch protein FliM
MNICLPFTTLEPIMDKLNTKFWFSKLQEKDDQSYQDTIEAIIDHAQIPMKAVLGQSTISVGDFANLQIGDIIRVDKKVDDELDVYVGNIKKFKALPGYSEDKYAVRVTQVLKEESE